MIHSKPMEPNVTKRSVGLHTSTALACAEGLSQRIEKKVTRSHCAQRGEYFVKEVSILDVILFIAS